MKKEKKSITQLIIELESSKRKLEEISKPEYIEKKVQEIYNPDFTNRIKAAFISDLNKILAV